MRVLLRVVLVAAGAAGLCVAFSLTASAKVVDAGSPYQPAATRLMTTGKSPKAQQPLVPTGSLGQAFGSGQTKTGAAEATPAPEQQLVTQGPAPIPAHVERTDHARTHRGSALHGAESRVRTGIQEIEAYLGRVTSTGQGGGASETGGPVIVLAVLSVVSALARRRVLRARWVSDEELPEFLYAWEVICPG